MKLRLLVFVGVIVCLLSPVLGSYEAEYGSHHAYPVHHPAPAGGGHQGWNAGQSAGSYYHYHVPLVGQQQSYHPQPEHHDKHLLWLLLLLPLLLLLALPLLLLPLLPLFLIPTGLALLALLMPMMMMMMAMPMGMMMMMMMMGMMPMMPMMKRDLDSSGPVEFLNTQMRTMGELLLGDVSSLMTRYSRSLDFDQCPERLSCEIGSAMFPVNASRTSTAKTFMTYVIENAVPSGKTKEVLRNCREALFEGSKSNSCSTFHCQPTFKLYEPNQPNNGGQSDGFTSKIGQQQSFGTPKKSVSSISSSTSSSSAASPLIYNSKVMKRKVFKNKAKIGLPSTTTSTLEYSTDDYYKQYMQQYTAAEVVASKNTTNTADFDKIKMDRILPYDNYNYYSEQPQENNELRSHKSFYSRFATPVVRA